MRPPRYKFPDTVRSATRAFATRAVKERIVPQTPAELHARILETADLKQSLDGGGYGLKFDAEDLFPLYEIFVVQAGGSIGEATVSEAPPRRRRGPLAVVAAVVAILVVVVAIALLR